MSDFLAPSGWKFDAASNNGDQTTFHLPGHSVSAPHVAIFDRSIPSRVNGVLTKPRYRLRVIKNFYDDVTGETTQAIVEVTIRWPNGKTLTDVQSSLVDAATVLSDATFQSDVVEELRLPRESAVV